MNKLRMKNTTKKLLNFSLILVNINFNIYKKALSHFGKLLSD